MAPLPPFLWTRLAVKGVLFRQGRVLLLRRAPHEAIHPGWWDLPGGLVEEGEGLDEALVREFREETGVPVRVGPLLQASPFRTRVPEGRVVPVLILYYQVQSRSLKTPRLDPNEHDRFAWVALRSLAGYRSHPEQREAVRRGASVRRR